MILVTGGTGFVGHEVVQELLALGGNVRLLVRNPERAGAFARHPRVQLAVGDALRPETLPPAMAGVQAVIHLIGIIAETSRVTYDQAHTEATRNLLAAAKSAGVTRWIQMSAIGTRPHARSRYHQTKWQAEQLVRQSGLDWTIFRPSLIYGYDNRDRLLNLLRRVLNPPLDFLACYAFPLIDGGENLVQPVSVLEVARCFALAPAREAAIGRTFDLVGPVPFSWREMIYAFLAIQGKKATYEEIPLLLGLRLLYRLTLTLFPLLILAALAFDKLSLTTAEIAAGLWVALLLLTARWRTVIIVNIPGEPLILASETLNAFAPRELQGSEILKMAVEDNIGDPRPATETFDYVPESFEQAVKTILR
jgi:uncharacterized protein YbjT (DUF2867 family)